MEGLHGTGLRLIKCTRSDTVGVDPKFRDSAPRTDGVFNEGSHVIAFCSRPRAGKVPPSGSTRNLPCCGQRSCLHGYMSSTNELGFKSSSCGISQHSLEVAVVLVGMHYTLRKKWAAASWAWPIVTQLVCPTSRDSSPCEPVCR